MTHGILDSVTRERVAQLFHAMLRKIQWSAQWLQRTIGSLGVYNCFEFLSSDSLSLQRHGIGTDSKCSVRIKKKNKSCIETLPDCRHDLNFVFFSYVHFLIKVSPEKLVQQHVKKKLTFKFATGLMLIQHLSLTRRIYCKKYQIFCHFKTTLPKPKCFVLFSITS